MSTCSASRRARSVLLLGAAILIAACGDPVEPRQPPLPELIVFSSNPPGEFEDESRHIYVIKPDGSDMVPLTTGVFAIAPAWSADGTMIAFNSIPDGDIYVMNADGSDLRTIGSGLQPTWSPDGREIVFTVIGALYRVGLDGDEPTLLHQCQHGCQWPAWSPDGSSLAFVGWPPREGQAATPRIHVMDLDDLSPVLLETGLPYEHLPAWSPDGSTLAFVGCPPESPCDLFLAGVDGTVQAQLTTDGLARSSPSFSRDGAGIVYYQHAEPHGIYVIDVDGGEPRLLRDFPEAHSFFVTPRWRP